MIGLFVARCASSLLPLPRSLQLLNPRLQPHDPLRLRLAVRLVRGNQFIVDPHEVFNLSDTDPVVVVVSRSDATEWENIIDFPSERRDADGVPPEV